MFYIDTFRINRNDFYRFCGGSCIEDVTTHLMSHLSLHPTLRTCSADTILRVIKELPQDNISYTSDTGKTYDFNTADKLNTLLLNCLLSTGQLIEGEGYDVDFDHQFIEAEKYDAKPISRRLSLSSSLCQPNGSGHQGRGFYASLW